MIPNCYVCILADNTKIEPNYVEVIYGEDVKFTCKSNGSVIWHHTKLPSSVLIRENILSIKDCGDHNAGSYYCEGKIEEKNIWTGEQGTFFARAILKVLGRLVMVIHY